MLNIRWINKCRWLNKSSLLPISNQYFFREINPNSEIWILYGIPCKLDLKNTKIRQYHNKLISLHIFNHGWIKQLWWIDHHLKWYLEGGLWSKMFKPLSLKKRSKNKLIKNPRLKMYLRLLEICSKFYLILAIKSTEIVNFWNFLDS